MLNVVQKIRKFCYIENSPIKIINFPDKNYRIISLIHQVIHLKGEKMIFNETDDCYQQNYLATIRSTK